MPEPLPKDLAVALEHASGRLRRFGRPIYFFTETGSTNDVAARLADRDAPEGTTVVAASQSAGRGRLGRDWFSPPGAGLYVSAVCRDRAAAPLLTLAGGVAVAEGILNATGLPVQIKWPNDIVVEATAPARRRKLAGILAEAASAGDALQYVVLGMGINLRSAAYPPDLADRATSIETELGRIPDGGAVLAETLVALERAIDLLASGETGLVLDRWRALAPSSRGTAVEWEGPAGLVTGATAGIDDTGALLIRTRDGIERIISGEVRWQ